MSCRNKIFLNTVNQEWGITYMLHEILLLCSTGPEDGTENNLQATWLLTKNECQN